LLLFSTILFYSDSFLSEKVELEVIGCLLIRPILFAGEEVFSFVPDELGLITLNFISYSCIKQIIK
jgi:hypothetical protein